MAGRVNRVVSLMEKVQEGAGARANLFRNQSISKLQKDFVFNVIYSFWYLEDDTQTS